MFEVVYHPMCGKSKITCQNMIELARTIAAELGTNAKDIKTKEELLKDSFVFLGCGCFANKVSGEWQRFIDRQDFKGRQVALFGTVNGKKTNKGEAMANLLEPAGALITGSFYCSRTTLPFLHRGHPSQEELASARRFASDIKNSLRQEEGEDGK